MLFSFHIHLRLRLDYASLPVDLCVSNSVELRTVNLERRGCAALRN